MKRYFPLLIFTLSACSPTPTPQGQYQGYVEGEYVYLASPQAGFVQELPYQRGQTVAAGDVVARLAAEQETAGLAEAQAKIVAAEERVTNLQTPHRSPEIAALTAQVTAAQAALRLAQSQLAEQEKLAAAHFVAPTKLAEAQARRDGAVANLEAAQQQLATLRQSLGRGAEIKAATADVAAAQAQAAQKAWAVHKKTVLTPNAGQVVDTYYRVGEWANAGAVLLSVLPDTGRKVRFFLPETALSQVQLGQSVAVHCDGCPNTLRAKIDFIAAQAEYTPPLLYSKGNQEKLVFRIEARPEGNTHLLYKVGLPLKIDLVLNKAE